MSLPILLGVIALAKLATMRSATPPVAPPAPPAPPAMVDMEVPAATTKHTLVEASAEPVRDARTAAAALYLYLKDTEPNPRKWGSKKKPNEVIRAAQRDLGVTDDGIYGPETRRAASAALGKSFPARS